MNEYNALNTDNQIDINKNLIAAYGLFCGACGIYLASKENYVEILLHYAPG